MDPQPQDLSDELPPDLKARIVAQLDFYFSDDNLAKDKHLLAKLLEGNGRVEIREVHGWYTNRKIYKHANGKWKAAVNESEIVEVVENKYLQRRVPFDMANAQVEPKANEGREGEQKNEKKIKATLAANPHLTRGMLKATGFERNVPENPLSAEELERNARDYDPALPITVRIENAIVRYRAVRKMHQGTAHLFEAFLSYCALENRHSAFTGGISKKEEEGMSKDELAFQKQSNFVLKDVADSLQEGDGKWVVNFEAVMKGFFSTRFMTKFDWHIPAVVEASCNVLSNFHRYLRRNEVCSEYNEQIEATLKAIDLAEVEYKMLAKAQKVLPGLWNIACSTLKGGTWANLHYKGDWKTPEEAADSSQGLSDVDANYIFMAGIAAYANEDQAKISKESGGAFEQSSVEEHIGFEITGTQYVKDGSEKAVEFFEQERLKDTVIPRMGKLFCKRYTFPQAAPIDVPKNLPKGYDDFEFIVDEQALDALYVGMKFEGTVKQLEIGFCWLDHFTEVYPSFFQWCWNEKIQDYKKPGPPKEWMNRINDKLPKPKAGVRRKEITNGGEENGASSPAREDGPASGDGGDNDWYEKAADKYFANDRAAEGVEGDADQVTATTDEAKVDSPLTAKGGEPITVNDLIIEDETSEKSGDATPWTNAPGRYWQGDGLDDTGSLNESYFSDEDFDDGDDGADGEGIEEGLANLGLVVQPGVEDGEGSVEEEGGQQSTRSGGFGLPTFKIDQAA